MFRLSKTTDYGIVLMAQLASEAQAASASFEAEFGAEGDARTARGAHDDSQNRPPRPPHEPLNARELAESSDLPVPMVSKILKALAKEGLLVSQRGAKGGYSLARAPEDLPVSEMIRVLEGPVALTDCAIGPALCEHEKMCAVREPWQKISRVVERALADVTLADLIKGHPARLRASASNSNTTLQIDRAGSPLPERLPERARGAAANEAAGARSAGPEIYTLENTR